MSQHLLQVFTGAAEDFPTYHFAYRLHALAEFCIPLSASLLPFYSQLS